MKTIFAKEISDEIITRIEKLSPHTTPLWGKMAVAQMLAHCNVTYELVYDNKHPKPNAFKQFLLKLFIKNLVVSDKKYQKNGRTAPEFIIKEDKNFDAEKKRLIAYIKQTQELGGSHFNGKASHSFGKLSTMEWSNMFYKHLDHHLIQFGV